MSDLATILLFAQTATDPISGGAGWIGAGLLGAVLCWLLIIHLPAKDKQLKELVESRDQIIADFVKSKDAAVTTVLVSAESRTTVLLAQKWEMIQALTKDYKESLKDVTKHCELEMSRLAETWQAQMGSVVSAITDLSEKFDRAQWGERRVGKP